MPDLSVNSASISSLSIDTSTDKNASQHNITNATNDVSQSSFSADAATKVTDNAQVQNVHQEKKVSAEEAEKAVNEMNNFMTSMQRNLSFSFDDDLGRDIVSVKDIESDEVIRQIPSEELVVLIKKMDDVAGILFDKKV